MTVRHCLQSTIHLICPVLICEAMSTHGQSLGVNLTPPGRELAGWKRLLWGDYINQYHRLQLHTCKYMHAHTYTFDCCRL